MLIASSLKGTITPPFAYSGLCAHGFILICNIQITVFNNPSNSSLGVWGRGEFFRVPINKNKLSRMLKACRFIVVYCQQNAFPASKKTGEYPYCTRSPRMMELGTISKPVTLK